MGRPAAACAALLLLTVLGTGVTGSRVRLVHNGYTGLVVGVDEDVDILQCQDIIRNLKTLLTGASDYLYTATQRRAYFGDVTVVVPSSWPRSCTGSAAPEPATTESLVSADLRVSGLRHPVHGAAPWTHQSGLCGRPGHFIQFAADYVASGETHRFGDQGRVLVHEWAKYRWGVFEETGYAGDRLYPSFHRASAERWTPTGCSNRPVSGVVTPSGCREASNDCTFAPFRNGSNVNVTSSIMSLQALDQVRYFCNATTHDRTAPTKHNLLCGERSVWEVMETHEDFLLRNNPPNASLAPPPPAFRVVKASADRLFLLLESSATMRHQERWDFVSNSLRKFVNWDVPTGVQVGIGHFGAIYRTDRNLTAVPDSRVGRGELANLPPIADDVTEDKKSWRAAVDGALAALGDRAAGTTLVWVTGNQPNSRSQPTYGDVQYIIGTLKERKVRLVLVFYPSVTPGLARAATETGGEVITVDDVRQGDQTSISVFQALADAYLLALERYCSDRGRLRVRLEERQFVGDGRQARGSFLVDSTLGVNTTMTVLYHDRSDIGYVKLKRPGGEMEPVYTYPDSTNHLQYVKIDTVHGQWEYEIDNLAPSHSSVFVQVTSSPASTAGTVRAQVWTNADRAGRVNTTTQPLAVYASVMQASAPVMDAEVWATLTRPNGEETRVQLLDNGLAEPDVLRGDGVYSRYVTGLGSAPGGSEVLLTLRLTVGGAAGRVVTGRRLQPAPRAVPVDGSQPCCGSSVGEVTSVPVSDLRREVAGGTVRVVLPPPGRDLMPPSRVTDLRSRVDPTKQTITFNWTAPGDDLDRPNTRVERYEVRYSESRDQLRDHFSDCMGVPTWSEPEPAGAASSATVGVRTFDTLLFFGIRGVDAVGNAAPVSNLVAVVVPAPPPTPSPPPPTGTTAPVQPTAPPFDNRLLLIVLLCVAGVIVLCVLLVMYYFLLYKRRKPAPDEGLQGYVNTVAMTTELSRESTPVKVPFDHEREGFSTPTAQEISSQRWAAPDILQSPRGAPVPAAGGPGLGLGRAGRARYNSYQTPYVEDMAYDGRSLGSTPPGGSVASLASAGRPRPDMTDSPWGRGADGRARLATSGESWGRPGELAGRLDSPGEPWTRGGASPGSLGSQSSRADMSCGDLGLPSPARPGDRRRRNVTQV
ncbi:calcium-activated chloride channel regulator 4A-like [Amphibalanus amphitrite]|uniref:calcium-activated chloride channel regulator 4A-like n=1 Tax=Amphibalanus amphitrite TaxID=1232801 RepID=UPI001C90EB3C|nr:calcium-activated chloride channel regulator 4A-like [Amphibalanus amphitrite]